jgi:hypothetical protein
MVPLKIPEMDGAGADVDYLYDADGSVIGSSMKIVTALLLIGYVVAVLALRTVEHGRRFNFAVGVPPSITGKMSLGSFVALHLLWGAVLGWLTWFATSFDMRMAWLGLALMAFFLAINYRSVRSASTRATTPTA